MTTLRTAAQQALEAMRCAVPTGKITLTAWYNSITALRAALAAPGSDYERGFVDGMLEQARRSVDKAVNAMAEPIIKPEIKEDNSVPQAQQFLYNAWADEQIQKEKK